VDDLLLAHSPLERRTDGLTVSGEITRGYITIRYDCSRSMRVR
jgi:hypothetical protein